MRTRAIPFSETDGEAAARAASGDVRFSARKAKSHPPGDYAFPHFVWRPLPYLCCDGDARENGLGGVLRPGDVVWLQQPLAQTRLKQRVVGFAASAGLLCVDARNLGRYTPPSLATDQGTGKESDHEAEWV